MKYSFLFSIYLIGHFAFAQTSGYAKSGDFQIYYEIRGSGNPVLMLQGGPGYSSEIMKPLAEKYEDQYQIITFDPRGIGKSKPSIWKEENITMNQMTMDIEAVRKAIGIKKWAVYGKSWGGTYASDYASKYPKKISSLVVSASAGIEMKDFAYLPIDNTLVAKNQVKIKVLRAQHKIPINTSAWRMRYNENENRKTLSELSKKYTSNKEVYSRKLANILFNHIFSSNFNARTGLQHSQIPTLILHGRHDFVPVQVAVNFLKIKPNSKLIIFEKSAHMLERDEPKKFNDLFVEFLNKNFDQGLSTQKI